MLMGHWSQWVYRHIGWDGDENRWQVHGVRNVYKLCMVTGACAVSMVTRMWAGCMQ